MATATATSSKDRFAILDIVRGIALFGVLLANMQWHSYFGFLLPENQSLLPLSEFNQLINYLMAIFVDGKFYATFSLLFGIGFSLIISKSGGNKIIYKRLAILLVIGLLHALILWEGDILVLYAVLGFSLPLFNKLTNKTMLIVAFGLLLLPIVLSGVRSVVDPVYYPETYLYAKYDTLVVEEYGQPNSFDHAAMVWQKNASLKDSLEYKYAAFYFRWAYLLDSNRLPKVLGLFLIGVFIGRNKLFSKLSDNLTNLKKVQKYGFLIGLPVSIAHAYSILALGKLPDVITSSLYVFSVFPLAFAYVASVSIWYTKYGTGFLFNRFSELGKMALTVYLLQSFVALMVFNGIGLGWAGEFSYLSSLAFGVVLFSIQSLFCHWWLSYFAYGPFEWLWRQMTYGRLMAIRKSQYV